MIKLIISILVFPLFGCGGGTPAVQKYTPAPKEEDPAVQDAIKKERELALKRKGRQSTILTPMGTDQTQTKTLLGS